MRPPNETARQKCTPSNAPNPHVTPTGAHVNKHLKVHKYNEKEQYESSADGNLSREVLLCVARETRPRKPFAGRALTHPPHSYPAAPRWGGCKAARFKL